MKIVWESGDIRVAVVDYRPKVYVSLKDDFGTVHWATLSDEDSKEPIAAALLGLLEEVNNLVNDTFRKPVSTKEDSGSKYTWKDFRDEYIDLRAV